MACTKCGSIDLSPKSKYYCRSCKKKIDKASYEKHKEARLLQRREYRQKIIDFLRTERDGRNCADCQCTYPWWVMEFDHLPEFEKLMNVTEAPSMKLALEELQKCEIVCANCHRHRTYERSEGGFAHEF